MPCTIVCVLLGRRRLTLFLVVKPTVCDLNACMQKWNTIPIPPLGIITCACWRIEQKFAPSWIPRQEPRPYCYPSSVKRAGPNKNVPRDCKRLQPAGADNDRTRCTLTSLGIDPIPPQAPVMRPNTLHRTARHLRFCLGWAPVWQPACNVTPCVRSVDLCPVAG